MHLKPLLFIVVAVDDRRFKILVILKYFNFQGVEKKQLFDVFLTASFALSWFNKEPVKRWCPKPRAPSVQPSCPEI